LNLLVDVAFEVVGVNDAVAPRIDKFEVTPLALDDGADAVARNAGRRLDDAYHPARQPVKQTALSDVGPSNYSYYR